MPAEATHYQSENWDIWIGRSYGNLVMEGFVKVGDALKHIACQVDDMSLTNAVSLTMQHGRDVRRPYVLGQACDGSISAPVMALYLDFCARHALDAQALYAEAYPEAELLEQDAITAFAHWQGVTIPHTWTGACFSGLLESLTEINCSTLRGVLDDAAAGVSFPAGVLEREGYTCFRGNTRYYGPKARFTWGHVITPTGEQVWQYDPWQSTNGAVPTHYWLSFLAVAAGRDGNTSLARRLVEEAERSARSPANKRHYQGWLESFKAAAQGKTARLGRAPERSGGSCETTSGPHPKQHHLVPRARPLGKCSLPRQQQWLYPARAARHP